MLRLFLAEISFFSSLSVLLSFMCVLCRVRRNHLTAKTKLTRIFNRSTAHHQIPEILLVSLAAAFRRSFEFRGDFAL
jgi:hypothetical protein